MFFAALSKFLQFILDALSGLLSLVVSFMPTSPFTFLANSQFGDLLAKINYFIPVMDFVVMLESWLVAIAAYYLYSIWARWVKAID